MILGGGKPPLNELAHFGVKGMKWGQHKHVPISTLPPHPTYTPRKQANDQRVFGKRGVARINAKLHDGQTRTQGQHSEANRKVAKNLAVVVGSLLLSHAVMSAPATGQYISKLAETNRGRAAIPALMNTASKVPYSSLKKGAYNITTMK